MPNFSAEGVHSYIGCTWYRRQRCTDHDAWLSNRYLFYNHNCHTPTKMTMLLDTVCHNIGTEQQYFPFFLLVNNAAGPSARKYITRKWSHPFSTYPNVRARLPVKWIRRENNPTLAYRTKIRIQTRSAHLPVIPI